jgi:hypothetical protein
LIAAAIAAGPIAVWAQDHSGTIGGVSAADADGADRTETISGEQRQPLLRPAIIKQAGTADGGTANAIPLKSVINLSADMKVDRDEVGMGGLRELTVEITNNTDRALIFEGNKASAVVAGETVPCVPESELDRIVNPFLSGKKRFESQFVNSLAGAATLGAVPTAKGILNQSGPVLQRYGCDEKRRENEVARFGKRIVWPGDSTKGIVYFTAEQPLSGAAIQMPVLSLYDLSDQAFIVHTITTPPPAESTP